MTFHLSMGGILTHMVFCYNFSMSKGAFIVIDGIDGSGKTTQIELLKKALASKGVPLQAISFPRYGDNKYTDQIEKYLRGEESFDPYTISKAYAADRLLAKPQIEAWLKQGKLVVANRYVSASKAHLGAKLPEGEDKVFFKWLDQLEYKRNALPKEDLTILLSVDPKTGQQNALKAKKKDINEHDLKHLEEAAEIYLELSKSEPNWVVVECMANGKMKSPEQIHKEILDILQRKFF